MRLSTAVHTAVIATAIAGVTKLPTKVISYPQERPAASGNVREWDGAQPKSTLEKQAGVLIEYRNPHYGFCFSLPASWRGFSIVRGHWRGYREDGPHGEVTVQKGPMISIRNPHWTPAEPRQDIPVTVFTLKQWGSLQRGEFGVSPAPIGPSELGRNRKYVFGLPPRYNYAFPPGYQEVEQILRSKPLDAGCETQAHRN